MKTLINMSIVTIQDDIYLAHTSNSVIYKIPNDNGILGIEELVVGSLTLIGDKSATNGKDALLKGPRNLIKNDIKKELFFIDNERYIKNVKIIPDSAEGTRVRDVTDISSGYNIFEDIGYTITKGAMNTEIFLTDLKKVYKINFATDDFQESTNTLLDDKNYIGLSYVNNSLYYCTASTATNGGIHLRKRTVQDLYNFNYNDDESDFYDLSDNPYTNFFGFVYFKNTQSVEYHIFSVNSTTLEEDEWGLLIYTFSTDRFDNPDYITNQAFNDYKIKALISYDTIFPSSTNENSKYILGRSSVTGTYRKINMETKTIEEEIKLKDDFKINDLTKQANINDNDIIYTNRYYNLDEVSILYHNREQNKLEIIKYSYSAFKTIKIILNSNIDYIKDIAINNDNIDTILYVADNNCNVIYQTNISEPADEYIVTPFVEDVYNIRSLHYTNNELHYITDNSYNIVDSSGNNTRVLSNITESDSLDTLDLVTDHIIDTKYEVGYIAFQERLKWFYLKKD